MKLTIKNDDTLERINKELIGNGGNSRLDIFLDTETGEVWTLEFYDHEENSWTKYRNEAIVRVGCATNYIYPEVGEKNYNYENEGFAWRVVIGNDENCYNDFDFYGDSWENRYNTDEIIEKIAEIFIKE